MAVPANPRRVAGFGLILGCLLAIVTASISRAAIVSFNPGDLSLFTLNGTSSSDYSITSGVGIGSSSGLTSTGGGLAVLNTSSSNAIGQINAVSIDYKQGTSDAGTDTRVGFVTATNAGSSFFNLSNTIWLQSIPFNGTSNQRSVSLVSFLTFLPLTNVIANEWYRLELTIQRRSDFPTNYNVTARRWDLGPNGTSAPTLVQAGSTSTFNAPGFAAAAQIYPGFEAYSWTPAYDDFAVSNVPEPSATSLLAALAAFYRRRK
jgi:hypothetical protein